MAPRISSKLAPENDKYLSRSHRIKNKIKEFQSYIKKNFEYVGNNFSYEARSIYYGEKKSKKGIFGTASTQELKELKDEGIETTSIPWVNDKEN